MGKSSNRSLSSLRPRKSNLVDRGYLNRPEWAFTFKGMAAKDVNPTFVYLTAPLSVYWRTRESAQAAMGRAVQLERISRAATKFCVNDQFPDMLFGQSTKIVDLELLYDGDTEKPLFAATWEEVPPMFSLKASRKKPTYGVAKYVFDPVIDRWVLLSRRYEQDLPTDQKEAGRSILAMERKQSEEAADTVRDSLLSGGKRWDNQPGFFPGKNPPSR